MCRFDSQMRIIIFWKIEFRRIDSIRIGEEAPNPITAWRQFIGFLSNFLTPEILLAWRRAKDFEPGYGVLSTSGAIFIWGRNAWGQLGNGNQLEHNSPLLLKTIRDQNVEFVTMGEGRKTDDKGDRENVGLNW